MKKYIIIFIAIFFLSGNFNHEQFRIINYWSKIITDNKRIEVVDNISYCGRPATFESFYGCYHPRSKVIEVWNKCPVFEFVLLHEIGHSTGLIKEHLANNYAYENIFSRYGIIK